MLVKVYFEIARFRPGSDVPVLKMIVSLPAPLSILKVESLTSEGLSQPAKPAFNEFTTFTVILSSPAPVLMSARLAFSIVMSARVGSGVAEGWHTRSRRP